MTNRFAGTCHRCGQLVAANAGNCFKDGGGKWQVEHVGPCPARGVNSARAAAPAANVGSVAGIIALFDRARGHLKMPAVELGVPGHAAIRINVAGERAREPGSLTVLSAERFPVAGQEFGERKWFGRILRDGTFQAGRDLRADPAYEGAVTARLVAFAADPRKVGAEDGLLNGRCCFCRKSLTDERSTGVGYGKKCASNWGFPWGDRPADFAEPARTNLAAKAACFAAGTGGDLNDEIPF